MVTTTTETYVLSQFVLSTRAGQTTLVVEIAMALVVGAEFVLLPTFTSTHPGGKGDAVGAIGAAKHAMKSMGVID